MQRTLALVVATLLVGELTAEPLFTLSNKTVPTTCSSLMLVNTGEIRDEIELTLQRLRYAASPDEWDQATLLLNYWLEIELDRFFARHDIRDYQVREELIQDTCMGILARLRRAQSINEPPRDYLSALYWHAHQQIKKAHRKRVDKPAGDFRDLPDTFSTLTPLTGVASKRDQWEPFSPPTASFEDYPNLTGSPLPLSDRQLAVLRGLAMGDSHQALARQLKIPIRKVHDAVGNVELKVQEALGLSAVRRSHMRYLPDVSAENRVIIECTCLGKTHLLLGEGPLPYEDSELAFLSLWIEGNDVQTITRKLKLEEGEARRLYLKLLVERKRDYDELYGQRESLFRRIIPLQISVADGEYALFRAFGVQRPEIAKTLKTSVKFVAKRADRLKRKIKDAMAHITREINLLRPYFTLVQDSRNEINIVVTDEDQNYYLLRAVIIDPENQRHRQNKSEPICVDRKTLTKLISQMGGRLQEVMELQVLQGLTTAHVAARLGIRVDSVRKHLASGTFQIGAAIHEPDLNLFNLKIADANGCL